MALCRSSNLFWNVFDRIRGPLTSCCSLGSFYSTLWRSDVAWCNCRRSNARARRAEEVAGVYCAAGQEEMVEHVEAIALLAPLGCALSGLWNPRCSCAYASTFRGWCEPSRDHLDDCPYLELGNQLRSSTQDLRFRGSRMRTIHSPRCSEIG